MKRRMALLLVMGIMLSMAACGSNTPEAIYESAAKKYKKADGVEQILKSQLTVVESGNSMDAILQGTLKIQEPGGSTGTAAFEGNLDVDMATGVPMNVPLSYYYTDEYMYTNMSGTQYKIKMDWEEAQNQMGPGMILMAHLSGSDFQEIKMTEQDSQTLLTFTVKPEQAENIVGAGAQWSQYKVIYGEDAKVTFQSAGGSFTIRDGYIVQETLKLTGTVQTGGKTLSIIHDIIIDVDSYKAADISLPELGSYLEIAR